MTPSAAQVTVTRYSGTVVLHIQGELDAATAPVLRAELSEAIGEETVLLDLTGVRTIDAGGLGALLGVIRGIHERGVRVAAAGSPEAVAALRAAGVDRIVLLADSPVAGLGMLHLPQARQPSATPTTGAGTDSVRSFPTSR